MMLDSEVLEAAYECKYALIGATAFAIGFAAAHPDDTLIIDKGIVLCPEYSLTMRPTRIEKSQGESLLSRELYRYGAVDGEGYILSGALSSVMSALAEDYSIRLQLQTAVTDVSFGEEKITLQCYRPDGFFTVNCERFINTLPSHDAVITEKYLNLTLIADSDVPEQLPSRLGGCDLVKGAYNEYTLKFACSASEDYISAYSRLLEFIRALTLPRGLRIAVIGEQFDTRYAASRADNSTRRSYTRLSAIYPSPIAAFEEGYKWNIAD